MQPINVILFVGDHPTSLSASSVGQVGCESTIIIQLRSVVLDKKRSITFMGGMLCFTCKYEKDPIKNS